jgi:hypothetical protein
MVSYGTFVDGEESRRSRNRQLLLALASCIVVSCVAALSSQDLTSFQLQTLVAWDPAHDYEHTAENRIASAQVSGASAALSTSDAAHDYSHSAEIGFFDKRLIKQEHKYSAYLTNEGLSLRHSSLVRATPKQPRAISLTTNSHAKYTEPATLMALAEAKRRKGHSYDKYLGSIKSDNKLLSALGDFGDAMSAASLHGQGSRKHHDYGRWADDKVKQHKLSLLHAHSRPAQFWKMKPLPPRKKHRTKLAIAKKTHKAQVRHAGSGKLFYSDLPPLPPLPPRRHARPDPKKLQSSSDMSKLADDSQALSKDTSESLADQARAFASVSR